MKENDINKMSKSITCKRYIGSDVQVSGKAQQKIRSISLVDL